jgi:pimeloyl-ACP methyl ester carboxylesterase
MNRLNLGNWEKSGQFFNHKNQTIFYCDEGAGEVLLCIHGFPTASWDWHLIWSNLTQKFRVIAPDMIGFGFSDKPSHYEYSIFDQATLHAHLLQSLGIDRIHILAHDYGDTVAQELLARYYEQNISKEKSLEIKSVCYLNGGLFPEAIHPRLIQRLLIGPLGSLVSKLISERRFYRSFSAIFGPQTQPMEPELKDFWSLVTFNEGLKVSHKIIRYMAERKKYRERWVGAMQKARVPLRLINGLADPVSGADTVARYRALIPQPNIVALENIGHYPQLEAPEKVSEAVLSFIENL